LGVREPALETERHVGPGSKVAREKEKEGGTVVSGTAAQPAAAAEEVKVGDGEAAAQREETWKKMRQEASAKGEVKQDPWKQTRRGAGESWQPKAWEPAASGKK
jgi:NADH dehydrogenase [ubiquinone] 1 alpha subcomplex assembly factor 2